MATVLVLSLTGPSRVPILWKLPILSRSLVYFCRILPQDGLLKFCVRYRRFDKHEHPKRRWRWWARPSRRWWKRQPCRRIGGNSVAGSKPFILILKNYFVVLICFWAASTDARVDSEASRTKCVLHWHSPVSYRTSCPLLNFVSARVSPRRQHRNGVSTSTISWDASGMICSISSNKTLINLCCSILPLSLQRNMPANYAAGTFEKCVGDSGQV
jgi:hypothetical protein